MKILVGTLYTIENEFDDCCKSIQKQTYKKYDHIVIRDLPKKEAHDTLFAQLMDNVDHFDLLIKVDADMVIEKVDLFAIIVEQFKVDSKLDLLSIAVHDYFTNNLIIGMNSYRNTVRWENPNDHLHTDMTFLRNTIRKEVQDFDRLAPAAYHCPNPGKFQSFHFGFHRGIKAVKGGTNWRVLRSMVSHYQNTNDKRVALALLGAQTAFTDKFSIHHISYNNKSLEQHFIKKYENLDDESIKHIVKSTKLYRLLKLPIDERIIPKYYDLKRKYLKKLFSSRIPNKV